MTAQPAADIADSTHTDFQRSGPAPVLRELHGIPVNGLSDSYMFKVDDEEFSRLDIHHAMFSAGLDGLFPSPATEDIHNALRIRGGHAKPAVLDIGTGSGAWSIEMAKVFPDADVVGMDLVPVKSSSPRPFNCRFDVGNADTDLAKMYDAESFDLIHARSMMQGVKDFSSFFQNVWRMLRPRGVFLVLDSEYTTRDEDRNRIEYKEEGQPGFSWFPKMIYHMREAMGARNPNAEWVHHLAEYAKATDGELWEKFETFNLYFPIGNFDSPTMSSSERLAGRFFSKSLSIIPDSIRPMLLSSGLTPEEVDRLTSGVRAELKEPVIKQFSGFTCTWAVKK